MPLLQLNNLSIASRQTTIVKNLSLSIQQGEWSALVGESGSGKSVTASSIGGILPRGLAVTKGEILFQNENITSYRERDYKKLRGMEISYIFQDYQGAFTPFLTIGKQFEEMINTHQKHSKHERKQVILTALNRVGLPEDRVYKSYPSQLSGGQLQRAAIAIATVLKPKLLIADEPTTALDSITAANVLTLLNELKMETDCSILFITHDLRHVRKYADRVAIMLDGEIVENGDKKAIFNTPVHRYTKQLFAAVPSLKNTPDRLLDVKEKQLTTV
ncbi:ABC transporter ATP-binding protein [Priestia megaterium]|nr:ABC transporter ATP-binding protein [Priestia megaterium]